MNVSFAGQHYELVHVREPTYEVYRQAVTSAGARVKIGTIAILSDEVAYHALDPALCGELLGVARQLEQLVGIR